jgi:hypothetical protein
MSEEEDIPKENPKEQIPSSLPDQAGKSENVTKKTSQHFLKDSHAPKQLESETMEVHKHPHHVTHKKKWGEYLLEFSMLFLAVFLGFIAENVREESVEHHREKEYMKTMLADLSNDTAMLHRIYLGSSKRLDAMDSMITIIDRETNSMNVTALYRLKRIAFRRPVLQFVDRTSSQLKNAGGMRLIRKENVIDGLYKYWRLTEAAKFIGENLFKEEDQAQNLGYKIFIDKYYESSSSDKPFEGVVNDRAELATGSELLLQEYSNRTITCKEIIKNYRSYMQTTVQEAEKLIQLIQTEYDLK